MKKHLLLAATFILIFTGITGCKKQNSDQLKTNMLGRWNIATIEASPAAIVLPGDYYDFKEGEDDIVEVRRNGNTQSGTYAPVVGNDLYITLAGTTYTCKITTITDAKLEFTAKAGNITEKISLKR